MEEKRFEVSLLVDGVKKIVHGKWNHLEIILEFKNPESAVSAAITFLEEVVKNEDIIKQMIACVDKTPLVYNNFRMELIYILEEKFGLVITVCGNCRFYRGMPGLVAGDGICWKAEDKDLPKKDQHFILHDYGKVADSPALVNSYSRCRTSWEPKKA